MGVKHLSMPHGNQSVTDETILDQFRQSNDPFLTASELADVLPMTRQGIHKRLTDLHETDELERKKVGRTVGWWLPEN